MTVRARTTQQRRKTSKARAPAGESTAQRRSSVSLIKTDLAARALSSAESAELNRCEAIISKGWETFVEVGRALSIIRDRQLYRKEYRNFAAYCQQRWWFGRA